MSDPAKIIAFVCNWEGYRGLELAAQKGATIPAEVKIVRVSCLSRLHTGLLLKAFEFGAGGVILIGCADHDCHYGADKNRVDASVEKTRSIMSLLGLRKEQLEIHRIAGDDGAELSFRLYEFSQKIKAFG
jgi:coenzyme F420-reducing hydrogenase delta subunit